MASLTSKPPSKPVQALNFIAEHTACWFSDESLQTANTVCFLVIIKKTIRPVKGNYYITIRRITIRRTALHIPSSSSL